MQKVSVCIQRLKHFDVVDTVISYSLLHERVHAWSSCREKDILVRHLHQRAHNLLVFWSHLGGSVLSCVSDRVRGEMQGMMEPVRLAPDSRRHSQVEKVKYLYLVPDLPNSTVPYQKYATKKLHANRPTANGCAIHDVSSGRFLK